MKLIRPLPRRLTRALSLVVLVAWAAQMSILVSRWLQAAPVTLAGDLGRYGASAQWKGVYYRGEKIGFMVSQTLPADGGYELQEDGQLQMALLGVTSAARMTTRVQVDETFALRSFRFSLDPGTGPLTVSGTLAGKSLDLVVKTASGERRESRMLEAPPVLALNLSRRLAAAGLRAGQRLTVPVFDPATLRNASMDLQVGAREVVRAAGRPVPAFRVAMRFAGVETTSWITDVGEVVREESPLGLLVLKETRERATALAVPGQVQSDMLQAAAIVPVSKQRIDDPASVEHLRLRLEGASLSGPDLQGAGQTVSGDVFDLQDPRDLVPGAADPEAGRFLGSEPFLESDDPEVVAEAEKAAAGASAPRARAEKLVRYVSALLEKKPTVSLPSAREVLRTKVGDCNEHTALFVAMARALRIPSRIAAGLVHLHGAFYYHAWPEVYLEGPRGRGLWLPVDPTLNQFPADATHVRLARGGLDKQAAILPLIGRAKLTILDLKLRPGSTPILVGRSATDLRPMELPIPRREGAGCWTRPGR